MLWDDPSHSTVSFKGSDHFLVASKSKNSDLFFRWQVEKGEAIACTIDVIRGINQSDCLRILF